MGKQYRKLLCCFSKVKKLPQGCSPSCGCFLPWISYNATARPLTRYHFRGSERSLCSCQQKKHPTFQTYHPLLQHEHTTGIRTNVVVLLSTKGEKHPQKSIQYRTNSHRLRAELKRLSAPSSLLLCRAEPALPEPWWAWNHIHFQGTFYMSIFSCYSISYSFRKLSWLNSYLNIFELKNPIFWANPIFSQKWK